MLDAALQDPRFPVLVSYPRTGSHHLRMVLELYFGRTQLPKTFFPTTMGAPFLFHTHDMRLQVRRGSVIYLYRDPVDVVFSYSNYKRGRRDFSVGTYRASLRGETKGSSWMLKVVQNYTKHLRKWILGAKFCAHKTLVYHNGLVREGVGNELVRAVKHISPAKVDLTRLETCYKQVTKEVSAKHAAARNLGRTVVYHGEGYEALREVFHEEWGERIWKEVERVKGLKEWFL